MTFQSPISAALIGELITAHASGDNDRFSLIVRSMIKLYEDNGFKEQADVLRAHIVSTVHSPVTKDEAQQ